MLPTPASIAQPPARNVLVAALLILFAVASPSRSRAEVSPDSTRIRRLSDYVDRLAAFGFSGQIVVAERGHIVLQKAEGWADRRFDVPMTMETRLGIAANSPELKAMKTVDWMNVTP